MNNWNLSKLANIGFQETRPGVYADLKKIAEVEHIKLNELQTRLMENYVKVHKAGNPNYTIDNFINNKDFIATPAFAATEEQWNNYFKKMGTNRNAWKTFDYKLEEILEGSKHFQSRFLHPGPVF